MSWTKCSKTGRGPGRSNRGSQHSDRSNLGGHKEQVFGAAIPKKFEPKRPSRRTKMIKNRAPEGLERFDRFHTPILAVLFFPAALHFRLSSAARFCMLLQITGFRETSLKFRSRITVCDFVEVCDQERLFSIDAMFICGFPVLSKRDGRYFRENRPSSSTS